MHLGVTITKNNGLKLEKKNYLLFIFNKNRSNINYVLSV